MTIKLNESPAVEKFEIHRITKNLLIIGNGFDLSSGLKSSYKDFFESDLIQEQAYPIVEYLTRIRKFTNSIEDVSGRVVVQRDTYNELAKQCVEFFENPLINIWTLIFRKENMKDLNWYNIEQRIEEIVCNSYMIRYNAKKIETTYEKIAKQNAVLIFTLDDLYNLPLGAYVYHNIRPKQHVYEFLLEELKEFEQQFCEYLSKEVQNNKFYSNGVKDLLGRFNISESNVLNFNYTSIKSMDNIRFENNVHGSLKQRNIIFGIDLSNLGKDDEGLNFSKTYRKMHAFEDKHSIHHIPVSLLSRDIEKISFFGHSLNSSDYSYFQSIFDFYEIYSSNMYLVFFYKIYDPNRATEIKKEFTNSVINLLNTYGDTMANKYHGKNLLHKLMLENRVLLKEI